jgi:uncharacterized protein YggE
VAIAVSFYSLGSRSTASSSSASSPETLAVIGYSEIRSQFDKAVITLSAQTTNGSLADGMLTIQNRLSKVTRNLASVGLSNVQTALGSVLIGGSTSFPGTNLSTIQQTITFTLTNPAPQGLLNDTQKVFGVMQKSGLVSQSQSGPLGFSATQVSFQFSDNLESQLHIQAYNGAIQNATNTANKIAVAQGLKIIGVSQVLEMSNQAQQPSSIVSFYLSLYGLGSSSSVVQATVQVTFIVQKS